MDSLPPSPPPLVATAQIPATSLSPLSAREKELCEAASSPDFLYMGLSAVVAGGGFAAEYALRYTGPGVRLLAPAIQGVTWGFFCSTPGVAVGRNLQRKHALEMLLVGDAIPAQQAMQWGLVNKVVPAGELDAATQELAAKLAAKPPAQMAAGKRGYYQQMDLGLEKAYELAGRIIAESFVHEEGRAGMDAFIAMLERAGVFEQYPEPAGRRARLLAADPQALIATIDALRADAGVGDQLARLTMPCLIILGEYGSAHEQARRAATALPNGAFVTIPGVGHAMAHADLVLPHVNLFLAHLHL